MSWHLSSSGKTAPLFVDDGNETVYLRGVAMGPWIKELEMPMEVFQKRLLETVSMCEEPLKEDTKWIIIDSLEGMDMPPKGMWKLPDEKKLQKKVNQSYKQGKAGPKADNKSQMRSFVRGKR